MFRSGVFKQAKYLVSTPQRSQSVVFVSETGVISKEILPMYTGYINAPNIKMTWLVLHALKLLVTDKQGVPEEEPVLLISERSYIPLDPLEKLGAEDKKGIMPLDEIAIMKNTEKCIALEEGSHDEAKNKLMNLIIVCSFILCAIMVISKQCGGP